MNMSTKTIAIQLSIAVFMLSMTPYMAAEGPGHRRIEKISDQDGIINESQVWNIVTLKDEPRTFLATNDGLFVYDGVRLRRHYSPKVSSLRDLAWDAGSQRLYSAGNTGFGWWKADSSGNMEYHPLEEGEYSALLQDFWRVSISAGGRVFFQSHGRLCIFDPESERIITVLPSSSFRYMHNVSGKVFIQDGEGLFRIDDNGRQNFVCRSPDRIMNIVECDGRLIIALERTGLMELSGWELLPLDKHSNSILSQAKIMSLSVRGRQLLLGTTQGGLFITDSNGRIVDDMNQGKETDNATVLSVTTDLNGDIWMGMEAGVARIDYHSNNYYLEDGRLGRVRSIVPLQDGSLLIGSNKGAFTCRGNDVFPIPGTTGSVWSVASYDDIPLIAHDQGLFRLEKGKAVPLFTKTGVMSIVRSNAHPELFICGTYNGLALFRQNGPNLTFQAYISNYTGFSRHILMDSGDRLWIRDSQKGFIRLTLNQEHTEVIDRKDFVVVNGENDILYTICLSSQVFLCCNRDAYSIDPSGELTLSREGCLLLCDYIKKYGLPDDRNVTGPFPIGDGCYATGLLGGISFSYPATSINESLYVSQIEALGARKRGNIPISEERAEIPYDMNTVLVHLAGNISGKEVEYRSLPGSGEWIKSSLSGPVQIPALSFGKHNIEFRIPDSPQINCTVRLYISRPWYLAGWAIWAYILLLVGIALGLREYYQQQARKEEERIQLKEDLKAKSKELANINFNNAKRNRQLNEIKAMLTDRKTVALIDGYLADESDWEKSEEYFNVIYDGLLEKLKDQYPGISKTDMKICVYTQLNLSTKEIADIMNISVRSVEMARYRLRKRLGLPPGQDISDMLKALNSQ